MRIVGILLGLLCFAPLALVALVAFVAPLRMWLARGFAKAIEQKVAQGKVRVVTFGSYPPEMRGPMGAGPFASRDPHVIDTTGEDVTDAEPRVLPPDREQS